MLLGNMLLLVALVVFGLTQIPDHSGRKKICFELPFDYIKDSHPKENLKDLYVNSF